MSYVFYYCLSRQSDMSVWTLHFPHGTPNPAGLLGSFSPTLQYYPSSTPPTTLQYTPPLPPTPPPRLVTGATILPVWPTCRSLLTKPASTAARDAPTAAPRRSARSYSSWKFSPFFMPRPANSATYRSPATTARSQIQNTRKLTIIGWNDFQRIF